ncbi:MAG: hypothetical protein WC631_03425 [Candidatus Paceibacterota bacterium]
MSNITSSTVQRTQLAMLGASTFLTKICQAKKTRFAPEMIPPAIPMISFKEHRLP